MYVLEFLSFFFKLIFKQMQHFELFALGVEIFSLKYEYNHIKWTIECKERHDQFLIECQQYVILRQSAEIVDSHENKKQCYPFWITVPSHGFWTNWNNSEFKSFILPV